MTKQDISCIILAGGQGKRVGNVDKGLLRYRDKHLRPRCAREFGIESGSPKRACCAGSATEIWPDSGSGYCDAQVCDFR